MSLTVQFYKRYQGQNNVRLFKHLKQQLEISTHKMAAQ